MPLAGDTNLVYFNRAANRGLIFQYAFDYADRNRTALNAYKDFSDYQNNFVVSSNEFNKMVAWLAEKGVAADETEIAYSKEHIITLFKAFLGRNVFDDEGFYPIYHQIDPIFQKALSEIGKQKAA